MMRYKNRIAFTFLLFRENTVTEKYPGLEIPNFFIPIPVSCTPPQDISRCICYMSWVVDDV